MIGLHITSTVRPGTGRAAAAHLAAAVIRMAGSGPVAAGFRR